MARILLGMSGGVDSSVAAALLKRAGHDVTGVTLKLWPGEEGRDAPWQERSCCKVGIARHVCGMMDIPHRTVDFEQDFRAHVVDDFLDGYIAGDTPNPCVRCNEKVKFAGLLQLAEEGGFDAVATGHYARIERTGAGGWRLLKGVDGSKDQSYFLYRLAASDLRRVRFPLGAMTKPQVMATARELGLPADEIAESQEICFVNGGDYRDFLTAERPGALVPGEIVTTDGTVVGTHAGVPLHTIGQRRGLNIALGERAYVVDTDVSSGRVVIGPDAALMADGLIADQVVRLTPEIPKMVTAKIRYRSPAVSATAAMEDGRLIVHFETPQRAVTPGQSVVLYDGDVVVGGGIIAEATGHAGARAPEGTYISASMRRIA